MMSASKLDRKVSFRRFVLVDDGFGQVEEWQDHGGKVWAHRADISDGEKWAAHQVQATVTTRFTVRSSEFSRNINPKDRLVHNGQEFNITGAKESKEGRFQFIELTASARTDQ